MSDEAKSDVYSRLGRLEDLVRLVHEKISNLRSIEGPFADYERRLKDLEFAIRDVADLAEDLAERMTACQGERDTILSSYEEKSRQWRWPVWKGVPAWGWIIIAGGVVALVVLAGPEAARKFLAGLIPGLG